MKNCRFYLYVLCFGIVLTMLSGCFVIRGTSDELRKQETVLEQEGPGTPGAQLYRWQNTKVECDDGNRIAIGFFPSLACGVEKKPGDDNALSRLLKKDDGVNVVTICLMNGILVGIPTALNLVFGPFDKNARRREFAEFTLLGCYEWEESSCENVRESGDCECIIVKNGPYREAVDSSASGELHFGNTHDGTRLYFSYPGNDVIKNDISSLGKVAVMFDHPAQKYRMFYPARHFKGYYAFKDVDVSGNSIEMDQVRYYERLQAVKASASRLLSHAVLGTKARKAVAAADRLLAALPDLQESALQRVEKYVDDLRAESERLEEEARRAEEARRLAVALRKAAEEGWRNEADLNGFALKESPAIWQVVQQLRAEVKARRAAVAQLRADLQLFGKDPDSDPDCQKLGKDVDALLDSLAGVFVNLENAYIAAKKYDASPSRKDYQDTMKRALEDGIQSATMAAERYKAMMRQK